MALPRGRGERQPAQGSAASFLTAAEGRRRVPASGSGHLTFEAREARLGRGRPSGLGCASGVKRKVVNWHRFTPSDIEYDFEGDELARHGVTFEEAAECFFSDFTVRRNKSYRDRYQLMGRTVSGRRLKIIFQLKPGNVVRVITGWSI